MNGNAEMLNYVYQNSEMGVDTIQQLLDIVEEEKFKKHLESEYEEYEKIHQEAKEMLNRNGYDEKEIGAFGKISAYLMINMKTMTDRSNTHIAEMMLKGSNMGIIEATKKLKEYADAEKDILALMQRLLKFEEKNVETLKTFL